MNTYFEALVEQGTSKDFVQWVLCLLTLSLTISATFWNKGRNKSRTKECLKEFPGLRKYWFLGSIPELYPIALNPARDALDWHHKMIQKLGPIFRYWIFENPIVVLADAEIVIKLYSEGSLQAKCTYIYETAKVSGGEGLVALPPDIHPLRRKQWMPSFTRKQVEMSIKFFNQQAIRLCHNLQEREKSGKAFDMVPLSVGCTFQTICYSAFGEDYMTKLPASVGKEHMHDLHTISHNMSARVFKPWLYNNFLYFNLTAEGRKTMKSIKRGNLLTKEAIQERKQYLNTCSTQNQSQSSEDFGCFLDHMLELMKTGQLSEEEAIQELNVFISAGYDTSGIAISFVLYMLSLYPEHQEKIVDELKEVFPPEYWNSPTNFAIDVTSIKKMKYLELCIKETMRLYTIIPVAPRATSEEVVLPDGRSIPKDVDVFVLQNVIHRDPKYFPEPDAFLPERHLQPIPAFMPFSIGSRNCIGQVYAMYEMKVILAHLLMKYKWETTEEEGFKPIYQVILVPKDGLHFKIKERVHL